MRNKFILVIIVTGGITRKALEETKFNWACDFVFIIVSVEFSFIIKKMGPYVDI